MLKKRLAFCLSNIVFFMTTPLFALQINAGVLKRPSVKQVNIPEYSEISEIENFELPPLKKQFESNASIAPKFKLNGIRFEGNHVFSDKQLTSPLIAQYIGELVSFSELETLRFYLTKFYADNGYINSGVLLEDQHIIDGIVLFRVVEGVLTEINIKGSDWLSENYIRDRIRLDDGEILQKNKLQERFQILLTDPLVDRLNGTLRPGLKLGETILDLDVVRAKPYELNVIFDNFTPPSIGSYTGKINGVIRNLTGYGDELGLTLGATEGSRELSVGFAMPLNAQDMKIFGVFQAVNSKVVEDALKELDIESDFYNIEVGFIQPLLKTLNRQFQMEALFSYREVENSILGFPFAFSEGEGRDGETGVSVARVIQNYVDRTKERYFSLRSTFSLGVDAFGATINKNDVPDSRFLTWIGQGRFAHQIGKSDVQIFVRGDVQLSNDKLLPLEKFAVGGRHSVRGYRENDLVSDEGFSVSTELSYPLIKPGRSDGLGLQIVSFLDYGSGWTFKENDEVDLFSAGVGLKSAWQWFDVECYWAHPFYTPKENEDYNLQDDGFHFQLTTRLF